MSRENPIWGAPRIHSELMKLDIKISEASIAKYMVRRPKPPSQTWRTFLKNHVSQLGSVDFFTVHTVWFQVLFVFIVLTHDRRRVVHFNVTAHPTAEWTAQQMLEAFPFDTAPRYLLRDRDRIYGQEFRNQVAVMNIKEVLSARGLLGNERTSNVTARGFTSRWREIRRNPAPYNPSAGSLLFQKSVACTIVTIASHNFPLRSRFSNAVPLFPLNSIDDVAT
jgi:hypothetical protein